MRKRIIAAALREQGTVEALRQGTDAAPFELPRRAGWFIPVTGWLRCSLRGIIRVVPRTSFAPIAGVGDSFFFTKIKNIYIRRF